MNEVKKISSASSAEGKSSGASSPISANLSQRSSIEPLAIKPVAAVKSHAAPSASAPKKKAVTAKKAKPAAKKKAAPATKKAASSAKNTAKTSNGTAAGKSSAFQPGAFFNPKSAFGFGAAPASAGSAKSAAAGLEWFQQVSQQFTSQVSDFQQQFSKANNEGLQQFSKAAGSLGKDVEGFMALGKGSMEALNKCSQLASEMLREMNGQVVNSSNKSAAENAEVMRRFFSCRTVNDMFDLNNALFKANVNQALANTAKLADIFFDYAKESSKPINDQITVATKKINERLKQSV